MILFTIQFCQNHFESCLLFTGTNTTITSTASPTLPNARHSHTSFAFSYCLANLVYTFIPVYIQLYFQHRSYWPGTRFLEDHFKKQVQAGEPPPWSNTRPPSCGVSVIFLPMAFTFRIPTRRGGGAPVAIHYVTQSSSWILISLLQEITLGAILR